MKKHDDAEALGKLAKLTRLIKEDKVKVEPVLPGRGPNKWRSKDPKFAPKADKRSDLVEAGGMQVDPSLKDAYEQWRQDKIIQQNELREMAARRAAAKRKARAEGSGNAPPIP
jgi:hypothetical protein